MFVRNVCAIILIFYSILSVSKAAVSTYTIVFDPLNPPRCGPLKTTISEEDDCYIEEMPTTCTNSTDIWTDVVKKCRPSYINNGQENVTYTCDGLKNWSPSYDLCQADCGITTSTNKFPWVTGIYALESDDEVKLLCEGVIISPYHLVTTPGCFKGYYYAVVGGGPQLDADKFTIIAGKNYRNENSRHSRRVKNIYVHQNYAIVLLEVVKEFEFSDDVGQACIDWELFYEEWDFEQINEGIGTGFRYDQGKLVPCEVSSIRYWQRNICWENLSNDFRKEYYSPHIFCAQYIDGNTTTNSKCMGSGPGLYFKSKDQRYFLSGLLNNIVPDYGGYILYAKVSRHIEWLKLVMTSNIRIYPNFKTPEKDVYTSTGVCILPDHIQYGKFSLVLGLTYPKGTKVSTLTVILLSCDDSETTTSFRCLNNEWYPAISQAICKKPGSCPVLSSSESEKVFCKSSGSQVSCLDPPANATAVIVCEPYYSFFGQTPVYKCLNGKWDPHFTPCRLECGTKRIDVTTLTIGGSDVYVNEYPWVTAIYYKNILVCGGTLISRSYVISAAHCFTNLKGIPKQIDEYTIIAGKYYRNISAEESGSQRRKIKALHVHEDYRGSIQRYRDDIALLELEKLTVSFEVQPACIDWESSFEDIDFTVGKMGVVAGWGFTQQAGSPSDVLKKIVVPFQPKDVCLENLPEDFSTQFFASDKICAGYKDNNTNVCKGDSGGGLYFKSDGTHYYLRGIVSLTVKSNVGCDTNHFSLYTKVSKYLPWIGKITRKIL